MEDRDYYSVIEEFLKYLDDKDVDSVCCMAHLPDEKDTIFASWNATPIGLATLAGALQAYAAREFIHERDEPDDRPER